MAADYIHISQGQEYLKASHFNITRPSSETTCCRRAADDDNNPSIIQDGLLQSPVRYVSNRYHLRNGAQLLDQTTIDFEANMILPRYMRQTIGSLQKAWVNRQAVSGRPSRTTNSFTYEVDNIRQLETGKNCPLNGLHLKPIEVSEEDNSGLTSFLHKGYGTLKNFDHAKYSLDIEDQATLQPGSRLSSVQYNAPRQPQRPTGAFNRNEPMERKSMPLLSSRCNGQSVLEDGTELPSFIGIFPLKYKLNAREIKSQKPSKQPLGALESEFGPQLNLRPMTCNSAKLLTGNRSSAQFHGNHSSRNSLKVVRDALKPKGNGGCSDEEADVETRLLHVKIRTSREDGAVGKLGSYRNCSAQTVRCTHIREELKTTLHRPATSTLTRATYYKRNASTLGRQHNETAVHRNVINMQETDYHRQDDKPSTKGIQLQQMNSEVRETYSIFPESSAAAAAVGLLISGQSVASIAPPLLSSPATTATIVNALAAPSVALLHPHHQNKSALFVNNRMLSSARIVSGNADKTRYRSARGRNGKVENENTTWLKVTKHPKSPNQQRNVRPVTAPATTKRFSNGNGGQSVIASEDEDERSTEKSEDVVDDVILRQTLLEKQEEVMKAVENSEEETQDRNERIFEWLLDLNYSVPEPPPSPVIIEETPMQTDTAIHIVYNGD